MKSLGSGSGRLDIGLLRTLGTDLVPRLIRGFLSETQENKIDFHVSNGLTTDLLEGLKNQNYDIAFCGFLDKAQGEMGWMFEIPKEETDFNPLMEKNY